jgi:ABC-type multidrug transport system fused ATPase/permease subunit
VFKNNIPLFIVYAMFLVLAGLVAPITVWLWKGYIDKASYGEPVQLLIFSLILYILTQIVGMVIQTLLEYIISRFNFKAWMFLDRQVCEKAIEIDAEYYEIPEIQAIINQANIFPRYGFVQLFQLGVNIIPNIVTTIGFITSLFFVNPYLCLLSFLSILPVVFKRLWITKMDFENRRIIEKEALQVNYFKRIYSTHNTFNEIKVNNAFDFILSKYRDNNDAISKIKERHTKNIMLLSFVDNMLRSVILASCVGLGIYLLAHGEIGYGGFSIVFTVITSTIANLESTVDMIVHILAGANSTQDYFRFIDMKSVPKEDIKKSNQYISMSQLYFRYPFSKQYALKNINVSIRKGEHIAIVGANGSGKSTFVKVLSELLIPTSGTLFLPENTDQCIWPLLSPVYQDYNRYKETLLYNVWIANVHKEPETQYIIETLHQAGFDKDIELDTMLSNEFGGMDLSGGEWQKVAIARAFWRDLEICILDEPTASIDPIREAEIYRSFAQLNKDKTTIFVSHRLGSTLLADRVFFFEDGEIIEVGSHNELICKNGKYAHYWNTQASAYILESEEA